MTLTQGPSGLSSSNPAQAGYDDDELDISTDLAEASDGHVAASPKLGLTALVIGAFGVVYGEIGTSPIYAFRAAVKPLTGATLVQSDVLGLLSLLIRTLTLIVTVKYVLILPRADTRGEGGVLSLYLLARLAMGRRSIPVLALGIAGTARFVGDAGITPAINVLSAFNPNWGPRFLLLHWAITSVVLGAVFMAVTGAEAPYADLGHFGRRPIMLAWIALVFRALVLTGCAGNGGDGDCGAGGHIGGLFDDPGGHSTGAAATYADQPHFARPKRPDLYRGGQRAVADRGDLACHQLQDLDRARLCLRHRGDREDGRHDQSGGDLVGQGQGPAAVDERGDCHSDRGDGTGLSWLQPVETVRRRLCAGAAGCGDGAEINRFWPGTTSNWSG